jgi:hypothetical protein
MPAPTKPPKSQDPREVAAPPTLRVSREGALTALELGLVWHQYFEKQDAYVFFAAATHEGALLGFNVYFPRRWEHRPAEGFPDDVFAWRSPMALARSVLEGAALARPLAALWQVAPPEAEIAPFSDVGAVTLSGRPDKVLEEKLRLKLFLGVPGAAEAELYLNLDFPHRLVTLREKNPAWRQAILEALVRGTAG